MIVLMVECMFLFVSEVVGVGYKLEVVVVVGCVDGISWDNGCFVGVVDFF